MVHKPRWTSREILFLKATYPNSVSNQVAKSINRSPKAIRNKASALGLRALERCHSFPRPVKSFPLSCELAYLIGAILGDGNLCSYRRRHYISLSAIDLDFVQEVRACISHVTGKFPKIYKVKQSSPISVYSHLFRVQLSNKSLFVLLKKPLEDLKPFIEPYSTSFLKGFFDAEGSAWTVNRRKNIKKIVKTFGIVYVNRCSQEAVVKYCNTDKVLLDYVRKLLCSLSIFPAPKMFITKGKLSENPKACYNLHIYRKASIKRFMNIVGTSISRKRLVLNV